MTPLHYAATGNGSAVESALNWIEGTLLGSVATAVSVIAVASIGFLMLTGRIETRRAAQVILGCFVVLGASSGLQIAGSTAGTAPSVETGLTEAQPLPLPVYPETPTTQYDPYAGAALTRE